MRGGAVDGNQKAIVRALRDAGRSVVILSEVGKGVPDLLVGWGGVHACLMEVKMPDGELTPDQKVFIATKWKGPFVIVRTVEQALRATGVWVR